MEHCLTANIDQAAELKTPPASLEAEQSVIGGLLLAPEAWNDVYDLLRQQHFYYQANRIIFSVISDLYQKDITPDVITVHEELKRLNQLTDMGGLAYLTELTQNTPSAANIKTYATIVRDRATLRYLIALAQETAEICYTKAMPAAEVIEHTESKLVNIAESTLREGGPIHIDVALKQTIDEIDQLFHSDDKLSGLSTGYTYLDKKTSGLQKGDLIIVAGRPSMGKTAFAMCLTENIILDSDNNDGKGATLVFNLEMPKEALTKRMLASLGKIPLERLRNGKLLDQDWPKLSATTTQLHQKPFYIDDTGGLTPMEMKTRARKIAREFGGLRLIVVDYLQLMRVPELVQNPTAEVGEISKSLKNLAKEHRCPVIAISQLNRESERRALKGHRPVLSDLRSSGQIEQDADLVLFVHRDEYYDEDTERKGIADIIIGKQRNGSIGEVSLAYTDIYTRFDDLEPCY